MNFKTLAIHAGHDPKEHQGAVMTAHLPDLHFCFPRRGPAGAV